MLVTRAPRPLLRPFVQLFWASSTDASTTDKERVLPTGTAHIAIRLSDAPLLVFEDEDDARGRSLGHAVLGGPRASSYVRDVSRPTSSVGAQLQPGAASLLSGIPGDELAGRHTPLAELFGAATAELHERLLDLADPERRLDLFEAFLAARLPRLRGLNPAVAHALARFAQGTDVRSVVGESGYSHRRFIALFKGSVGLTPKLYCRVARLQRALQLAASEPAAGLSEIAIEAGFADQPHLNRDFRKLAGLSPGKYKALSPRHSHHVPIGARRR